MEKDNIKKPTKILFVSPIGQLFGGGERSGFEFCKYLLKKGYDVETVLPKLDNQEYSSLLEENEMKYHIAPYVFDGINRSFELEPVTINETLGVVDIVHKIKPDVIISNISAFTHGALAATLTNTPHIWMERGNGYRIEDEKIRNILNFVFKYSNAVITNSSGLAKVYKKYYDKQIVVGRSYTALPKVGLDERVQEQRIIAVSRLSPEKNILELLKAVNILVKKYPDFKTNTIIMGHDEGTSSDLRDYLSKNEKLSRRVKFIDFDPNPWRMFGKNDIYVNTSFYESVGRSTVEALRLGLPVVLSNIPGHEDIFDLVGGYKYELGNPENLADKLNFVINNPNEVKKQTRKWKKLTEKAFSEENCSKSTIELINSLVGSPNPVECSDLFKTFFLKINSMIEMKDLEIIKLRDNTNKLSNPGIKLSIKYLLRATGRRLKITRFKQ